MGECCFAKEKHASTNAKAVGKKNRRGGQGGRGNVVRKKRQLPGAGNCACGN